MIRKIASKFQKCPLQPKSATFFLATRREIGLFTNYYCAVRAAYRGGGGCVVRGVCGVYHSSLFYPVCVSHPRDWTHPSADSVLTNQINYPANHIS